MANTIIKTKVTDGPMKSVYHFYFEGDGSDELDEYELLDPTLDFDPPVTKSKEITILQVWHSLVYFDLFVFADGLVPAPSWMIARDSDSYMDFRYFGGLKIPVNTDPTGKLLVSSNDFNVAGSRGTLIMEFKKN